MSWKISKFTTSLMGLLSEATTDRAAKSRVEAIRVLMLDQLADLGLSQRLSRVRSRIQGASDVQALWYLRSDVMLLLAEAHGEPAAAGRLADISEKFRGLLPAAQKSRPSRLHK